MRHLGAVGFLIEIAEGEYKPTNFSLAMSLPSIRGIYVGM